MGMGLEVFGPRLLPAAIIAPCACGRTLFVKPGFAFPVASNHVVAPLAGSENTTA